MRIVPTEKLLIGDIIGKPIYASDGKILLQKGVSLTAGYIAKLHKMGVSSVYVMDPRFNEIEVNEPISQRTRLEVNGMLSMLNDALQLQPKAPDEWNEKEINSFKKRVNVEKLHLSSRNIVEELLSQEQVIVHLVDMRAKDDHLLAHSVMVAMMATLCGIKLDFNRKQLEELALGALLHDIGLSAAPDILGKQLRQMTPEEAKTYREHPRMGFEILRKFREINLISSHVAFQHHETLDGNGFPRNLTGDKIHIYAKIVGVADFFDHLIHGSLGLKALPHMAYEVLMALSGTKFEYHIVQAFCQHIAIYPNGSSVRLSTGEVAVVVRQNTTPLRPVVRVVYEDEDEHIRFNEYDLTKILTLFIVETLN